MSEPTYGASFRRDGMTIRHETEVEGAFGTPKAPARFTREDVEKAAKAIAEHTYAVPDYADASDCREWDDMPDHVRDTYVKAATAALAAIGGVDHG